MTSRLNGILGIVPTILNGAVDLLPASWGAKVTQYRHVIVSGAAVVLSITSALQLLPLPVNVDVVIAIVSGAASIITTQWAAKTPA